MELSVEQRRDWFRNGYLILPAFFDEPTVNRIVQLHDEVWETRPSGVIVDELETGKRLSMADLKGTRSGQRCKINDLYLVNDEIRSMGLDAKLSKILKELLIDPPVLCNSLNFDYGSEQPLHVDSLYMTPPSPGNLVATWVALEDALADSGPLRYYPGSHIIPLYRFSDGSMHAIEAEMPLWQDYMRDKVREFELKEEIFLPKKGDVLIWHSYLLHGGTSIRNRERTRMSLVSHYLAESDCLRLGMKMKAYNAGFYYDKVPLKPGESIASAAAPMGKVERFVRTTIHYGRQWLTDIGSLIRT